MPNKLYLIKPLEWERKWNGYLGGIAGFTDYEITERLDDKWELGISRSNREDFDESYVFSSLDAAKSKAQEDWNNRISQYLTEYKEEK